MYSSTLITVICKEMTRMVAVKIPPTRVAAAEPEISLLSSGSCSRGGVQMAMAAVAARAHWATPLQGSCLL